MAIFKPGPLATDLSGSIGGTTFSHNRGGMYCRNRSIPTNPSSPYQMTIRTILSQLSAQWRSVVDHAGWNTWAAQNPVTNAIGEQVILTGHQAYIQLNARINLAADTTIIKPPVTVAPTALTSLTITAVAIAQAVTLGFTVTPLAATERLWISGCLVSSAGIHFVNNYMRWIQVSPKTQADPCVISTAFIARFGALTIGQVAFARVSVLDTLSGQLSMPRQAQFTVIAA